MRRAAVVLVMVVSACNTNPDDPMAGGGLGTTTALVPTTALVASTVPTTPVIGATREGLRAALPAGDDPCGGHQPPFDFGYLPPGFRSRLDKGPPRTGTTVEPFGGEPYDPVAHVSASGGRSLNLYHGNSWRLVALPRGELSVFGRPAVLSAFEDGDPLVEFRASTTGSGCDWWAIEGVGVDEATLLRVVRGLRLR